MSEETKGQKELRAREEFERVVRTLDAALVGVDWHAAAQAAAASLNKIANKEGLVIQVKAMPSVP